MGRDSDNTAGAGQAASKLKSAIADYYGREAAKLYIRRDTMRPRAWRLCWSVPDSDTFVNAEGECSAVYYRTMREAIAAGVRRFGETAVKADW